MSGRQRTVGGVKIGGFHLDLAPRAIGLADGILHIGSSGVFQFKFSTHTPVVPPSV